MVYIYGYLVPAAIAEFEKNWDWKDGPSGPEKVTEEDFRRVQDALIGRSSMPRDDFGGKPWIK